MSQRRTDTSDRIHDSLPLSISNCMSAVSGIVFQSLTMAGTLFLLWTFAWQNLDRTFSFQKRACLHVVRGPLSSRGSYVRWLVSANASEWLSPKSLYYPQFTPLSPNSLHSPPIHSTLPWITPLSPNSLHSSLYHSTLPNSLHSLPRITPQRKWKFHTGNENFETKCHFQQQGVDVLKVDSGAKVS